MVTKSRFLYFWSCLTICTLHTEVYATTASTSSTTTKSTSTLRGTATPLFLNPDDLSAITGHKPLSEMDSIYSSMGKDMAYKDYLMQLNSQRQISIYKHIEYSTNQTYRDQFRNTYSADANIDVVTENRPFTSIISDINSQLGLKDHLLESDILVPNSIFNNRSYDQGTIRKRYLPSGGIAGQIWGLMVPYKFIPGYSSGDKQKVLDAMDKIKTATCIDFHVKSGGDSDYLDITNVVGCSSAVGKHGGAQVLSLASTCVSEEGIILHELLHALGIHHTQSRLDRDNYISINTNNVAQGDLPNFDIYPNQHTDPYSVEYDYQSVMHYGEDDFSTGGTVITPLATGASIGQRNGLSYLDKVTLNLLYGCYDKTPHYWPMDEIDTTNDLVVGTTDVTGPTFSSDPQFLTGLDGGYHLNALRIRSEDGYANLGSHPNKCLVDPERCNNGFTLLFWLKIEDRHLYKQHIISSLDRSSEDRGFEIQFDSLPLIGRFLEIHVQQEDQHDILPIFNDYKYWNHIAVTWSTTNGIKSYVNGTVNNIPAIQIPNGMSIDDNKPSLIIGKSPDLNGSDDADFLIDDVVFWEKEISVAEICNIRDNGPYHDIPSGEGSHGRRATTIGTLTSYVGL
ncbi:Zinc metalloproteinase nas-13 [Trichoplax sp. H2]|uniref:Metalloendopeptidase n=1 Tax=Trichoplax adhaerens TaxID=10228 RepID=B3RTE4_TRIAD|nr:hypothetical protein TRIADDRAFT_54935 [Trichoplax adhaerens]EDV26681.1 hypothetical protein TRIADDRAFT_54935 [Trichoplax adhaerens]RDD39487.1 Zinc metalloproteinase nas-13 [Trichoplax sp. H2]|eukprot:XP_002110677.1 hypothetical protein TRIADDRAFT_54935 [Trichoplax adhaerens]